MSNLPLAEDPEHRALDRRRSGLAFFKGDSDRTGQYYAEGSTISLTVPRLIGNIEQNHCSSQIEAVVNETDDQVELTLYSLQPGTPPPREADGVLIGCPAAQYFSTLPIELSSPLNDRPLIWAPSGEELPVSDYAKRREPVGSPNGWKARTPFDLVGSTSRRHGPVVVETLSPYTKSFNRIEGLQNNPNHEMVEVADGVEAVLNRRGNGAQRLAFIWDDWFYDIIADPGTDTDELVAFAASFEPTGSQPTSLTDIWQLGEPLPFDGSSELTGRFYTQANKLHIVFPHVDHLLGVEWDDRCTVVYEAEVTESDTEVSVATIATIDPSRDASCDQGFDERLAVDLDKPLGARSLISAGTTVRTAAVDQRLTPSEIPEGWQSDRNRSDPLTGGAVHYGPVIVTTQAASDNFNIAYLAGNPGSEPVDVLSAGDGALILRADNSAFRLGFEDSGWIYDFVAQPGVGRDELLAFARSFRS